MINRTAILACAMVLASAAFGGCKLIKNETDADDSSGTAAQGTGTKLDSMVDGMWQPQVMPYFEEKAVDLAVLAPAVRNGLDKAGKEYGYRPGVEGTPWTFAARFVGRIVAADTETRAATAAIDIDGDGKSDATVQLGPVVRGTALRDALPFISFSDFADQIEFAGLSRALNSRAYEEALAPLPRENLEGRELSGVGAFTMRGQTDEIRLTPVTVNIGPAP